jgi:hypothetical protein
MRSRVATTASGRSEWSGSLTAGVGDTPGDGNGDGDGDGEGVGDLWGQCDQGGSGLDAADDGDLPGGGEIDRPRRRRGAPQAEVAQVAVGAQLDPAVRQRERPVALALDAQARAAVDAAVVGQREDQLTLCGGLVAAVPEPVHDADAGDAVDAGPPDGAEVQAELRAAASGAAVVAPADDPQPEGAIAARLDPGELAALGREARTVGAGVAGEVPGRGSLTPTHVDAANLAAAGDEELHVIDGRAWPHGDDVGQRRGVTVERSELAVGDQPQSVLPGDDQNQAHQRG